MSTFKSFGIFSVPMLLMILFELFGQRPKQMGKILSPHFFNVIFAFNFLIVYVTRFGYMINYPNVSEIKELFDKFYNVLVMTNFILLACKFYKDYNLNILLEEIRITRHNNATKKDIIFVCLLLITTMAGILYNIAFSIYLIITFYQNGKSDVWEHFTMKIDDFTSRRILIVVENYSILICRMSLLCTSFMISVIAVALSREFDQCRINLRNKIKQSKCITNVAFLNTTARFYELRSFVQKVDEMFSDIVALNLTISLGILCMSVYALLQKDGSSAG